MTNICHECEENEAGEPKTLTFSYKGFKIKTRKDKTCRECAIKKQKNSLMNLFL